MRSSLIEEDYIGLEKPGELFLVKDQEVIHAFSSDAPQKAFTNGICLRSSVRGAKYFDATRGSHARKIRSEFAIIIPNQILWCLSIRSCLPQLLCYPEIVGVRVTFTWITFRDFSEGVEECKKWTKEKISNLQEIASPHFCCMITEKRFPGLSVGSKWRESASSTSAWSV